MSNAGLHIYAKQNRVSPPQRLQPHHRQAQPHLPLQQWKSCILLKQMVSHKLHRFTQFGMAQSTGTPQQMVLKTPKGRGAQKDGTHQSLRWFGTNSGNRIPRQRSPSDLGKIAMLVPTIQPRFIFNLLVPMFQLTRIARNPPIGRTSAKLRMEPVMNVKLRR